MVNVMSHASLSRAITSLIVQSLPFNVFNCLSRSYFPTFVATRVTVVNHENYTVY